MIHLTMDELEEIKEDFKEQNLIFDPNSINHGWPNCGHFSNETLFKIEIAKLTDFIEFLFEHSEHCDHITQTEAWNEFDLYQYNKKLKEQK